MQRETTRRRAREEQELNQLLTNWPALAGYVLRVGAITRNARSHAVQEMDEDSGYWLDLVRIKVERDGTIDLKLGPKHRDEEIDLAQFAPSDQEQEQIKQDAAKTPFPHSIPASLDDLPSDLTGVDPREFFVYRDPTGKFALWIQWRREDDEGRPYYLPYSMWSDNIWRKMEPDGPLPLYGLDRLAKNKGMRIMVHEGAKCSRDTQALVDGNGDHPWITELSMHIHVGWPGGVNSADRVDWSPIKKVEPHIPVVLVCDNDVSGKNVASIISRILQRSMMAVRFDNDFPHTFDLADPWPRHESWWQKEHYRGPTFDEMCFPITWATKAVRVPNVKKPVHKIVDAFSQEWLWVEALDVFINRHQINVMHSRGIFNSHVRPFSDVKDTAALLDQLWAVSCNGVAYEPGSNRGEINLSGMRMVNTYRPTDIKPVRGDSAPFTQFLTHLFPIERERGEVLRWLTTLIARPGVRMRYALLLISQTQGVGKTTLAMIAARLVGLHNVSFPTEHMIGDSGFTSWVAHKRLAIISEIHSGQNRKTYDRLKDIVADDIIDVNEKYLRPYSLQNWLHVIACSNSTRPMSLDDTDRRWFIPRVTEELRPKEYWDEYNTWLRGDGLGIILNYLIEQARDSANIVGTGEHAPTSATKEEVIEESRSAGEQTAYDLGVHALEMNTASEQRPENKRVKVVLTIDEVRIFVANRRGLHLNDPKLETPLELRKALVKAGLFEPELETGKSRQRFMVYIRTEVINYWIKTFVVANFPIAPGTKWNQIKEHYRAPKDVWPM